MLRLGCASFLSECHFQGITKSERVGRPGGRTQGSETLLYDAVLVTSPHPAQHRGDPYVNHGL